MKKVIPLLWFSAVFLTIFSARLWLIDLYGSALPWWDQWAAEGWLLYIPFFDKTLVLKDLFTAHCEHRIFVNRVMALILIMLNGQWDARLGMMLNAFIAAATGVVLSAFGWTLLGRKNIAIISLFNTIIFSLPFSWECSVLGFVGNYWLIAFAIMAIWFLIRSNFFDINWFLGFAFAILSLVTMGSGFLAAAAFFAILILRLILGQGRPTANLAAAAIMIAVVAAGYLLRVTVPGHAAFQPANVRDLIFSFLQNLAWPNLSLPWTALVAWLPLFLLLLHYVFRRAKEPSACEFLLAFGLWVALQDAALAFSRSGVITSRHTVFLCLALPVNFLALLLLLHERPGRIVLQNLLVIIFLAWACNAGYGLWKATGRPQLAEAEKYKKNIVQCEKNVRAFIQTDDMAALENKPLYNIPFPDPNALAIVLRNAQIRAILPECANPANKPGPLSLFASKIIPKGDKLIYIGISLLLILTGVHFYQSLGVFEKRLAVLRRNDFKQISIYIGLALGVAILIYAFQALYSLLSPGGLTVTYFRGINFEKKICGRTEKAVCRDYDEQPPAWHVPRHYFSALWQGVLRVPETTDYYFYGQSDDGLRLIIDGKKIIDNWRDQSWNASVVSVQVYLEAGDHQIAIEHYNGEGEAAIRIKWCGGPIPANTILAAPYLRKYK